MGNKVATIGTTKMPSSNCRACHGMGSVRMTIHFYVADQEWEAPCWECFGSDGKLSLPRPQSTDN
jgi:DnaJ-class molecular chaperone